MLRRRSTKSAMAGQISLMVMVLTVMAATACGTSEKTSWEQVLQQNTPEGYRQFIQRNPQGKFLQPARERLSDLDSAAWHSAVGEQKGDSALRHYVSVFPDGAYAAQATAVLEREGVLAKHFLPEVEHVRVAIIGALQGRYAQAASSGFTLGQRMAFRVDRRTGRSVVWCSASRKDPRGKIEVLAAEDLLESPLAFDVRRSAVGEWSVIVGESLWVKDDQLTDEMTVLSPTPIQTVKGDWGKLAVVWNKQPR